MATRNTERKIKEISEKLLSERLDALTTYLELKELYDLVENHPDRFCDETVSALNKKLNAGYLAARRLQYLTYREAARIMASIILSTQDRPLAEQFIGTLKHIVNMSSGSQRRGVAEVLGSLPLHMHGPEITNGHAVDIPTVKWHDLSLKYRLSALPETGWEIAGRSIIFHIDDTSVLVIKLASDSSSVPFTRNEAWWMNYLESKSGLFEKRFHIPKPLKIINDYVFHLEDLPEVFQDQMDAPEERYYALAYRAHRDYFAYPNDHRQNQRLETDDFREVMFRNAWLLGRLTSRGIIHTAPIPLFHNRVQRNRRPDSGLYEWQKGGRLDRWLTSCRYPNFGVSGLRDFEHLVSFKNNGLELYKKIGTHILSLILVVCSYFRNIDPDRFGRDEQGEPVDVRDFFDKPFLRELIQGVFSNYYHGFSGVAFEDDMPADFNHLIYRMVQEMGMDNHMDEWVRIADQKVMSATAFDEFLKHNQLSNKDVVQIEKGKEDLAIVTGPHLGEFGREISIPELTEFLEVASATCVLGKYLTENKV
jgi:hypothetical protein